MATKRSYAREQHADAQLGILKLQLRNTYRSNHMTTAATRVPPAGWRALILPSAAARSHDLRSLFAPPALPLRRKRSWLLFGRRNFARLLLSLNKPLAQGRRNRLDTTPRPGGRSYPGPPA